MAIDRDQPGIERLKPQEEDLSIGQIAKPQPHAFARAHRFYQGLAAIERDHIAKPTAMARIMSIAKRLKLRGVIRTPIVDRPKKLPIDPKALRDLPRFLNDEHPAETMTDLFGTVDMRVVPIKSPHPRAAAYRHDARPAQPAIG